MGSVLQDKFAKHLGIAIAERRPGYARISLKVQEHFLNGLNFAHGGVIFSAADYAFALASNTSGESALGINASINFIKAASLGDELVAEVKEVSRGRRLGTYQGTVTNQNGDVLAQFQSMAYIKLA